MFSFFKKRKIIVTHSGGYHADDIFACATLSLLEKGRIRIVRTRDDKDIVLGDYVVDVGGVHDPLLKRFDHHQAGGAGVRANGIPYASFGLVWKEYGAELTGSAEIAEKIDERLVQSIDAPDNGINTFLSIPGKPFPYLIHNMFNAFQPSWREDRCCDGAFGKLVILATMILRREIIRTKDFFDAESKVEEAFAQSEDKRIIVLTEGYPWEEVLMRHSEPLFVVAPRSDGKWKVECVYLKQGSFERRLYLPDAWGAKSGKELEEVTGIRGAVFCHANKFIVVAETKDIAYALAMKALAK